MAYKHIVGVTILILVDGFLQLEEIEDIEDLVEGHNPYFSRWFSAIRLIKLEKAWERCHNPYFSRWFSAIRALFNS